MQRVQVVLGAAVLAVLMAAGAWLTYTYSQPAEGKKSTIKLILPYADAKLSIDGKRVKGKGEKRTVEATPQAGKEHFIIQAVWEPNNYTKITRTRKVAVKEVIELDMSKASKDEPDDIVVRYVPTPDDIVEAMCKLAKVGKEDVVYDLGCGDGRMVICAVEKFHAKRGVGVDLDEKLVAECKENAKKHGVEKKVEFRVGDVLKIKDIPDATVVLLYMGDDINERLKPILQAKLKPGSRVVSHRFLMGDDWPPTKTERVTGQDGGEYELHLWIIEKKK
jgi:uncharacterized protein (TIGR03000 family)